MYTLLTRMLSPQLPNTASLLQLRDIGHVDQYTGLSFKLH